LQLDIVNRIGWLHQGCDIDLSADFHNFGATANNFPFKNRFEKCFKIQNRLFSLWRRDLVLELQFLL